jgi:hypothetical protein
VSPQKVNVYLIAPSIVVDSREYLSPKKCRSARLTALTSLAPPACCSFVFAFPLVAGCTTNVPRNALLYARHASLRSFRYTRCCIRDIVAPLVPRYTHNTRYIFVLGTCLDWTDCIDTNWLFNKVRYPAISRPHRRQSIFAFRISIICLCREVGGSVTDQRCIPLLSLTSSHLDSTRIPPKSHFTMSKITLGRYMWERYASFLQTYLTS